MNTDEHRCRTGPALSHGATALLTLLAAFAPSCRKTPPAADGTTGGATGVPGPAAGAPDSVAVTGDAGPAAEPDGASAAQPTPDGILAGDNDALHPAIVAAAGDWLVAWEDNDGTTRRLLTSTVKAAARGDAPKILATGPAAQGVRLAARTESILAVWLEEGASPAVVARRLDAKAEPAGAVVAPRLDANAEPARAVQKLSGTGSPLGLPEVAAWEGGFVAVWAEGGDLHSAKLGADGTVAATTFWPGGNTRPWREIEGVPRPAAERAQPYPVRPTLVAESDGLHAFWWGAFWESDDQGGEALYERLLAWPDAGGEPATAPQVPVWAALDAVAAGADGKPLAIQSFHDPNGGPWQLAVRRLDVPEAEAPFTSEPAGPLRPALVWADDRFVAAWPSSSYGVALVTVLPDGANSPLSVLPCTAPPGEAEVALAADGTTVRVAYIDRSGARSVVRTAGTASATGTPATPSGSPSFTELALATDMPQDVVAARLASGETALVWKDYAVVDSHVSTGWLDATGTAAGETVDLTPGEPRCDFPSVAALPGAALAAWSCCAESSICGPADVRTAVLRPGAAPIVRSVTPKEGYWATALAADGERIALVMARGEYSRRRTVVRIVRAAADAAPAALAAAADVVLPATDPDQVGSIAAAWGPTALAVAFHDREAGTKELVRLFLVAEDGTLTTGTTLVDAQYGIWGDQRLAAVADGFAILGVGEAASAGDVTITWLSPDLSSVLRRTVVGRGAHPRSPALSFAGSVLAATWYDAATDGNFAALAAADGARLLGPVRLDDPAQRASFGSPIPVPAANGAWRLIWSDARPGGYGLCTTELKMP
ncbi:MAG: hypothetical protein HY905_21315 [Deltaproteobacteria bacterium]|nr:hypothetical protein [Deltaproteobacteria bacterium]